jgi:hypothetical protein
VAPERRTPEAVAELEAFGEQLNPDLAFRSGHQGVMVGERAAAV